MPQSPPNLISPPSPEPPPPKTAQPAQFAQQPPRSLQHSTAPFTADDDRETLPVPESPFKSAGMAVIFTELHAAIADKAKIEIPPAQPALLPLVAQLGLESHQYPGDPRAKSDAYERLQATGSG
jgi:hypothetical protein